LKNRNIAGQTLLFAMLIIGIIASLISSPSIETFLLVAFVLFTASKSIARLLSFGLVWPLLLLVWKTGLGIPGSKKWRSMNAMLCSIIPFIISALSLYHLIEFDYFVIIFTSIHFLKYSILVWDVHPTGLGRLSFFLFFNVANRWGRDKRIKDVWHRAILPFLIIIIWQIVIVHTTFIAEKFLTASILGISSLMLFLRTTVDLINHLLSSKLNDKTIEIFFNEGSLFYLIAMTLLISFNMENTGLWFILSILIVGDFIILQTDLIRIPTFSSVHEFHSLKPHFFSNHQFFFIPLFYFLVPITALIFDQVSMLMLFCSVILVFSELKIIYAFFLLCTHFYSSIVVNDSSY